jgi:hypothetical protein
MNLVPSFPTLSIHGDDVVHMNCTVRFDLQKARMISIDMSNKTLQTLEPCLPVELDAYCPHFPCVLSKHLSNTPALPQAAQVSNSENVAEGQHPRSCAQDVISVPSRAQNGGLNFDLPLPPQQNFGLLDAITSYSGSAYEYANHTRPSNDNYQRSLPLQQQPVYRPYWPDIPRWFSLISGNARPACPVFNTAALGQMVHPLPVNHCHLFQPPSHAVVLPMPSPFSINTSLSGWQPYSWH